MKGGRGVSKQLLIAIGREFGSGGHEIARRLAERFQVPLYDRNILEEIALQNNGDVEALKRYDEMPKRPVVSRVVEGLSSAPQDGVAQLQFAYLRDQAEKGLSFVVLGRCADEVLSAYPGLISIFVLADEAFKLERIMARDNTSRYEALSLMERKNRQRRSYHNQHCEKKWGEAGTYDLTINSARMGIEGTVDVLEQYIRARAAQQAESV